VKLVVEALLDFLPERKTHAPRMAMATRRRAMGEGEEPTRNSDMAECGEVDAAIQYCNGRSSTVSERRTRTV
jgi:hypothetical protein